MSKIKKNIDDDEKIASFPSETLVTCVDIVSQMVKRKGETSVSFKEIGIILGRPIGTLALPVSTCTQYGLLENIHGKGYKPTELFNKIEMPVYKTDRLTAIIEALSNAPLYKILISEFNGKILPDEEGMANHLVKNFGIKPYLIQKVVKVFFKNFRDFILIDTNNRMRFLSSPISTEANLKLEAEKVEITHEIIPTVTTNPITTILSPTIQMFEQAIDLGGTDTAYLKYPRGITLQQVGILKIHLEATLAALEARNKIKNEND